MSVEEEGSEHSEEVETSLPPWVLAEVDQLEAMQRDGAELADYMAEICQPLNDRFECEVIERRWAEEETGGEPPDA